MLYRTLERAAYLDRANMGMAGANCYTTTIGSRLKCLRELTEWDRLLQEALVGKHGTLLVPKHSSVLFKNKIDSFAGIAEVFSHYLLFE